MGRDSHRRAGRGRRTGPHLQMHTSQAKLLAHRGELSLTHQVGRPPPSPGTGETTQKSGLARLKHGMIYTKVVFILLRKL